MTAEKRELWPHQKYGISETLKAMNNGERRLCLTSPTGGGKCLGRGTPVLMFDGSIKMAEDIVVGDILIGPDSRKREVISVCNGVDNLFRVIPTKGMPYVVNGNHLLSLKMTNDGSPVAGTVINISVNDYADKSKTFKHCAKGYRVAVDFNESPVPVDPYYLGIWLGDGSEKQMVIHKPDPEILEFLQGFAKSLGLIIHTYEKKSDRLGGKSNPSHTIRRASRTGSKVNPLLNQMRALGVVNNKHVPGLYKSNSREIRRQVLAGLLDTDGHLEPSHGVFDFISRREVLSNDCAFLARSLGLSANVKECQKTCVNNGKVGTYWRVCISGDIDMIPTKIARKKASPRQQKKNPLVTGIKIEPIGLGEYFGFQLSGPDSLFLLGDFTVTHNSSIISELIKDGVSRNKKQVLYSNRKMLTEQLIAQLCRDKVGFGVRAADFDEHDNAEAMVQICSIQTDVSRVIGKRRKSGYEPGSEHGMRQFPLHPADVVFVDECHLQAGGNAAAILNEYHGLGATIIGITATPLGVGHLYDRLIVAGKNSELRECGALVPAYVKGCAEIDTRQIERVRTAGGDFSVADIRSCWSQAIYGNVADDLKRYNPEMKPFLLYAPGVEESIGFESYLNMKGIKTAHIDGTDCVVNGERYKSSRAVRQQILADHKAGEIYGITNRLVLREAIDMPWVENLVIATPIGSLSSCLQVYGRGLRASPSTGKLSLTVHDHGGCFWRHGSPNADRDDLFREYFDCPDGETLPTDVRLEDIRNEKEPCPLCCPACGSVQLMPSAGRCYSCGHDLKQKRSRFVIQRDGKLVELTGLPVKPRQEVSTPLMEQAVERSFWAALKKDNKSFASMRAWIASGKWEGFENLGGRFPAKDMKYMPMETVDLFRKPSKVDPSRLHGLSEREIGMIRSIQARHETKE